MIKKLTSVAAAVSALAFSAMPVFAYENPITCATVDCLITSVLSFILTIAGGIALLFLAIGGIQYMASGGDKMAVESSRGRITAAVAGLVIVFGSWLVINIVCNMLGADCAIGL